MGMSTHVIGIRPPDATWQQMKAVYDACQVAGVAPPQAVDDFFNGEPPDARGVVVEIQKLPCVRGWTANGRRGYEVDVTALPPGVTIIRFYNSW